MNTNKNPNLSVKKKKQNIIQLRQPCRDPISQKWRKKLRRIDEINRAMASNINFLMTNKIACDDMEIKYLKLKKKVLDTEEKLLMNGINTTEYPAFCSEEEVRTSDSEVIKDPKFELLLLIEINRKK
ncbi:unnamed protein product [Macrosiphum euphorbiae]|uniref:Uncharacterized protein n=1 Tax=Macrosiphum euphorbiae TaxID=13131 RepID=A0AAV0WD71_9HEMI|nr:unnamed protein product [Macrosiphum euphorbiae]